MRRPISAAAIVAVVALAGCGNDDAAERSTVTVTAEAPAATAPPPAQPEPAPAEPAPATEATPGEPSGAETYRVRDAGEVTIAREGDRLRLVRVSPAAGWSHRVTEQEPREIEITFRRGGREVEFEAELEGGRVVTKVDD